MRTALVGFCQCAASNNIINPQMVEFIYLCLHANLKFPQRIIVTQDAEKHDDEVSPHVKTLYILLTTDSLTTQLLNFCLVKQIYYLSIHRLSGKMCTFANFSKMYLW